MAVRKILRYPRDRAALREKSEPIHTLNPLARYLIEDLKETLLAHSDGIGLAAPQIGVYRRIVVVRLGGKHDQDQEAGPPVALINPEIVEAANERMDFDGCLSFPGLFGETKRPHYLRVTGAAEDGSLFDRIFTGFDAVLLHHELDHLEGVLFIDRAESLDDLYRVCMDGDGNLVRVLLSEIVPAVRLADLTG